MTAALLAYLRVSTERQESDGYGLDTQLADAQAFADRMGMPIPRTYTDTCSGTVPAPERPGFGALLASLRQPVGFDLSASRHDTGSCTGQPAPRPQSEDNTCDVHYKTRSEGMWITSYSDPPSRPPATPSPEAGKTGQTHPFRTPEAGGGGTGRGANPIDGKAKPAVILPRLDRLARDLIVQESALAALWSAGAQVYDASTGEPIDGEAEPTRVLIRQVIGAIGQYDRAQIVARMAAGRAAKRRAGGYAGGAPPYGYSASGGTLVPNRREQAALARARELRSMGLSLRGVGESLELEGYLPRRAARWSPKVVRDLVA